MGNGDKGITRRGFVAGAGAAAVGLGLAGCAAEQKGEDTNLASTSPEKVAYDPNAGEWIPTVCNMCFNNCSIKAHVVDGVVVELTGNPDGIGSGHICAKGAAGIMTLYDPNRLTKPLRRTNPKKGLDEDPGWEEISWDEAWNEIMTNIGKVAAENPMAVGGASMVSTLNGSVQRSVALACAFGGGQGLLSDICGAGIHVIENMFTGTGNSMPDYQYCRYVIQFGTQAGTATRHGFNMTADRFADLRANEGLRLVSFDPHMSAGAEKADLWVPIRPGSDAAAALAMANVLVEKDLIDRDYLCERTNAPALVDPATKRILRAEGSNKALFWDESAGAAKPYDECAKPALEGDFEVNGVKCRTAFSIYKDHIASMTPEWAEEITTVPAATLRQVAEEFGTVAASGDTIELDGKTFRHRPVAVDLFSGISRHKHAILSTWSCLMLNLLVGAANSVGGFLGYAPRNHGWIEGNPQAGYDIGIWEEDGFIVGNSFFNATPVSFYDLIRNNDYTPVDMTLAQLQPLSEDGHFVHVAQSDPDRYHTTPIKALFWYGCNPLKWWGNWEEQAKVLLDMDYIVGCDISLNETSYFSDLMIPEACYLERYDALPHWFLNHRQPGGLNVPWTVEFWQPVVEAKDGAPGYMDIWGELVWRAGEQSNAAFIGALNAMYRLKEEYQLPLNERLDPERFVDSIFKSFIDEEHGIDWFREHGVYTRERKVDEVYIWDNDTAGRIPFYWDFMLEAKEKVDAKVAELGIPWESDDYIPLPEWRPGVDFYPKDDPAFDIFPVYYTNAQNTDSWLHQNPWINEVNEEDGVTYMLEMNTATAAAKGLASGDEIRLTSTAGYSVEGKLVVSDGVHPECVSGVVGTWDGQSQKMAIAQGKGSNLVSLIPGTTAERMDHLVSAFDQLVRVKVEKIA
ncbi:molybdopterin-dependent oxidoreductase [Adlercreutzia sp. R21]|uniref:molybdopterin-dependent oxidoreductase n=1 Tax=Adlercreutzia wanghongyangiae TaxID=3111451 RepID=UPI002DBAC31C|nr:molybdopterin-dependent oxidoreductase [Adlercreutzia sp. R21]MEC4183368.1 molybdopterin-dependent oxidoreductase [Adlercreutzia sp. R21]